MALDFAAHTHYFTRLSSNRLSPVDMACTLAGPPGANGTVIGGLTKTIAASATTPTAPIAAVSFFGFRALAPAVVTTDFDAAAWIAPRDGTLVRLSVTVTNYSTTGVDRGQFAVFAREGTDPVSSLIGSYIDFPTSATTQHQLSTFSFPIGAGTRVAVGITGAPAENIVVNWDSVSVSTAFQAAA